MRKTLSKIKFIVLVIFNQYFGIKEKLKLIFNKLHTIDNITLINNVVLSFESDEDRMTFTDIYIYNPYKYMNYNNALLIDIGGHKGYYAIFALLNGAKKVMSYEFEENNLKSFQNMIDKFSLSTQIEIVPKAMSNKEGSMNLNVYDTSWSHSIVDRIDKAPIKTLTIDTVSLGMATRDISNRYQRNIVKSNSEGAECIIFQDIPSSIDEMLLAYHPFSELTEEEFILMVEKNGFKANIVKRTKAHIYINFKRL
jgi:FkbM family methyltransferase